MSVVFSQDLSFTYVPKCTSYIMSHPNATSKHILNEGIFEKSLIDWARSNYQNPEKVFVDIGAHMGTYTLNLAPHFKHTYAFEAQKNTYYCLTGGIALNGLSSRATAYHCALTNPLDSGGVFCLKVISPDGGGSSIKDLVTNATPLSTEKVETKTLDSFEIQDVGLIKIDVEGAELDVLKGSLETLKRCSYPPILFEAWPDDWYHEHLVQLLDYVKSLGYKVQQVYSNNMYLATQD